MTAYNLIKSLTKRGNTVIGSGCYAAAITMSTDPDKVIKIGNNVADPWLSYYSLVSDNKNNPCVPRIYSLHVDSEHNYYVAIIERLEEDLSKKAREAMDLCKEFVEGWYSEEEFLTKAENYEKQLPYPKHMLDLLIQIKNLTTFTKHDSFDESDEGLLLDMHYGNFLSRDGALIVTDPWCETNMQDIDDVNSWAGRHNLT